MGSSKNLGVPMCGTNGVLVFKEGKVSMGESGQGRLLGRGDILAWC